MKQIKLCMLAVIVALSAGCASNNTIEEHQIVVGSKIKESIEILDRRATLNDAICARTSISLECELLPIGMNNPVHQFMRFDLIPSDSVTTIKISRWLIDTTKPKDKQFKKLDLSQPQVDAIETYIERHRNKFAQ